MKHGHRTQVLGGQLLIVKLFKKNCKGTGRASLLPILMLAASPGILPEMGAHIKAPLGKIWELISLLLFHATEQLQLGIQGDLG